MRMAQGRKANRLGQTSGADAVRRKAHPTPDRINTLIWREKRRAKCVPSPWFLRATSVTTAQPQGLANLCGVRGGAGAACAKRV